MGTTPSGTATNGCEEGRVRCDGKHLTRDGRPFRVNGVTYGTFRHRADGAQYPKSERIEDDFAAMAAAGVNTVRTYTVPPADLLDAAEAHRLSLIVGLQYHDWRLERGAGRRARQRILDAGRAAIDEALERCADRRCLLALAVGNELPADLVRLRGSREVADVLSRLIAEARAREPALLTTYVNFPSTEFLEVEGQDLICFNVFLERPEALRSYLRRLQIVAGSRPLLLTELGLASSVHGREAQARSLAWQLETVAESGCAGACVFSWTDEWAVDDRRVDGWGFGLTTEARRPRPSLEVFSRWAASSIPDLRPKWPRLSVVVCAYNEESTIRECLESLAATDYPDLEVIVCIDGGSDRTRDIAATFPFRILDLPHGGLSKARNVGLAAAGGEIVAYLDADAACHPHWPYHLALALEDPRVAAAGGPNLSFDEAGDVERAVARSPGDPTEVLLSHDRAEHVPGCNLAFRAEILRAIGGFEVAYTTAGDDVDVCWRLLDERWEIAFAPAAQVRHHRRRTVGGYLRQQIGYGRAEKMLAGAHPHRFNGLGQAKWDGVVYAKARLLPSLLRPIVYHGCQGGALFQPVTHRPAERATGWLGARLPLLAAVAAVGAVLTNISSWWWIAPVASLALLAGFAVAVFFGLPPDGHDARATRVRALAAVLHVAQPLARLWGRLRGKKLPPSDRPAVWQGDRREWLRDLERRLEAAGARVEIGREHQVFDLEVRTGWLLSARVTTAVVWGWEPRHRVRWRCRPAAPALLVLSAALWRADAGLAIALVGASASLVALEARRLRLRLRSAILDSTRSAKASAPHSLRATPRGVAGATANTRAPEVLRPAGGP